MNHKVGVTYEDSVVTYLYLTLNGPSATVSEEREISKDL
jgi:hypothetical protein